MRIINENEYVYVVVNTRSPSPQMFAGVICITATVTLLPPLFHFSCYCFYSPVSVNTTLIPRSKLQLSSLLTSLPQPTLSSSIPPSLPKLFVRRPDLDTAGWVCLMQAGLKNQILRFGANRKHLTLFTSCGE